MTNRLALAGEPAVEVTLRRMSGARRLSLRVSRLDGRVTLTAPPHVPLREVKSFLNARSDWVRGHLVNQPAQVVVRPGIQIPVQGEGLRVVAAPVRGPRREGAELRVAQARAGLHVKTYLKEVARQRLGAHCDACADQVGRRYSQLVLRDTRSRWGSCSSAGRLMFSWRLAMAPPQILDYVAAHEVAHLVEMNHSAAFWGVVGALHPGYLTDRRWLRDHGAWLHRYRFDEEQE